MKVRGRSHWDLMLIFSLFTEVFTLCSCASWRSSYPLSAATDAIVSFLVCTFQKVIVLAKFDFFFFCFNGQGKRHESRAKNIIIQRVTLGERGLSDGELWRSSLISELPRRDKGPLKSQETEQSKSRRTFQEKHDPGRCFVWTSDESFNWASVLNY